MDSKWKNNLQEYCQKHKIRLPNYRIKKQSGPPHILKFQVIELIISKTQFKNVSCIFSSSSFSYPFKISLIP